MNLWSKKCPSLKARAFKRRNIGFESTDDHQSLGYLLPCNNKVPRSSNDRVLHHGQWQIVPCCVPCFARIKIQLVDEGPIVKSKQLGVEVDAWCFANCEASVQMLRYIGFGCTLRAHWDRIMIRRQFLKAAGSALVLPIIGPFQATARNSSNRSNCVLVPSEIAGPLPLDLNVEGRRFTDVHRLMIQR